MAKWGKVPPPCHACLREGVFVFMHAWECIRLGEAHHTTTHTRSHTREGTGGTQKARLPQKTTPWGLYPPPPTTHTKGNNNHVFWLVTPHP